MGIQSDDIDSVTLDTNITGNVFTVREKAGQPLLTIPQILEKKQSKTTERRASRLLRR